MENIEGAVNNSSDAPPASEPNTPAAALAPDLGSQSVPETKVSPAQPVNGAAEGDTAGIEAGIAAEAAESPEAIAVREKLIPRERFEQVNTRYKELEAQQATVQRENQEWREAASLGLQSVEQYHAIVQEAQNYGYPDARSYIAAVQQSQALQAEISAINERFDISDEAKQELVAAKQERLQNQQQLQQAQYLNRQMLQRTLNTSITEARATIGVDHLPEELEDIFRQSPPEIIAQTAKAIKALMATHVSNGVAEYAANKVKAEAIPAPEGRGGDPPAPARSSGSKDFKNTSFSQLLGFGRSQ